MESILRRQVVLFVALCLMISATAQGGLRALWSFGEGSGTLVYDSSGKANTGTLTGPNISFEAGKPGFGNAISIVNDNVSLSYVNIPADPSLAAACGALFTPQYLAAKTASNLRIVPIAKGWAKTAVNATLVNSIATHGDTQIVGFYDENGRVILARRKLGTTSWQIRKTRYTGNVRDAHNTISIAFDGAGVLHMSWDHHGHPLRYCRSVAPGSLELTDKMPMTGQHESRVTYPEFYNLSDGDLLFLYRDGGSGSGDTMLNRYDVQTQKWSVVQHPLIKGKPHRNAYTNQIAIDKSGAWHISWCWREHGGVETNHDICYAKSVDGGRTWQKSTGEKYILPITADNAEYACRIPQASELINANSMTVDSQGRPLISTYWRPPAANVPQYQLIYHDGKQWQVRQISRRKMAFSLSGGGTKYLPLARTQTLVDRKDNVYVIFRDVERQNRASVAICKDPARRVWRIKDLTNHSLGEWEPSCDHTLWQRENVLHLFVQRLTQHDKDRLDDTPPSMVSILEWTPN